jgi:BirA family biotin operon repressor/biotin-[acetyl-CoA-carboxylase] ligase
LNIERFTTLPSTNDVGKERGREGAPEWTVILAETQTAGRGRQGRSWASPPGNLCMSVLLRPAFEAVSVIPLLAGLAVAEVVADWGVAAQLKWPNDVVVGERKLAGILAEAASSAGRVEFVVLGIGMNLVLDPADAAAHLRETLTSVRRESGGAPGAEQAATAVLARLGVWYHALAHDGPDGILEAWRARSAPWWGRTVEVEAGGAALRGIARDIDATGALILETEAGERVAVVAGDARALRLATEG